MANVTNYSSDTRSVQNKIAWFSKKPKPSPVLSRPKKVWSSSVENVSNKYVSPEELRVLRGCVSERLAMFSSTQYSSLSVLSGPKMHNYQSQSHQQYLSSPGGLNLKSFPSGESAPNRNATETISDYQSNLSSVSHSSIPDSVSVQFRSDSCEHIFSQKNCEYSEHIEVLDCCSNTVRQVNSSDIGCLRFLGRTGKFKVSRSGVDSVSCNEESIVPPQMCIPSPLLRLSQEHSRHNSWPRKKLHQNRPFETHELHIDATHVEKSFSGSPHHLQKPEPVHIVSMDIPRRMSETEIFGSTSSVFSVQSRLSSATNVSSCTERPHLNFAKGVNGIDFKQRSDVRSTFV